MTSPRLAKVSFVFHGKRFNKVNIEISNVCNLQCSFCPEVVREKGFMSLELFTRVIEQVGPLTHQVCFHLMGDPLVHPKLSEFADICDEYGTEVFLVTNGVLLREKQAEILLRPTFRQVCFSLHSFADNFGEKDPTVYLERIFSFCEKALEVRPGLYINLRLWNLDAPQGTGPQNREVLRRIEERFGVAVDSKLDVRLKKHAPLRGKVSVHFDTEFTWPSLDLPVLGLRGTCHGLSNHFGVLVDGTVVPCCLDKEAAIPLGKIQDTPVLEIIESPRAKAILKGFTERRLVEELCKRCQYIERYN